MSRKFLSNISSFSVIFFSTIIRSSRRRCSVRKRVLRNFAKFTGKHLCQSHLSLRPATLLKKRLCFPVNFAKFPRTHFLQNTSRRLRLHNVLKAIYKTFCEIAVMRTAFHRVYCEIKDNHS